MAVSSIHHNSTLSHPSCLQARFPILFSSQVFHLRRKQIQFSANYHQYGSYCVNCHRCFVNKSSDVNSGDQKDSMGEESCQGESLTANEILQRLKRYGISGVLSYGLLNTAYYLSTFLFVWLCVAPPPGRMGYPGAAKRLLKVLAMVWAGSQVTKLVRAGGALALAPFVDRGLSWFILKFKFESRGKISDRNDEMKFRPNSLLSPGQFHHCCTKVERSIFPIDSLNRQAKCCQILLDSGQLMNRCEGVFAAAL